MELSKRMDVLCQLTPEEFNKMEVDPDPSIAWIVNKIKTIASSEQKGSYLNDAVNAAGHSAVSFLCI